MEIIGAIPLVLAMGIVAIILNFMLMGRMNLSFIVPMLMVVTVVLFTTSMAFDIMDGQFDLIEVRNNAITDAPASDPIPVKPIESEPNISKKYYEFTKDNESEQKEDLLDTEWI